jgi:hypothetical protein
VTRYRGHGAQHALVGNTAGHELLIDQAQTLRPQTLGLRGIAGIATVVTGRCEIAIVSLSRGHRMRA